MERDFEPLNLHCFSQPHWRVQARGLDAKKWFDQGVGVGTGGIANPQPIDLPTSQRYYRFASGQTPLHAQLGGSWWIDFENYLTIERYASRHALSLSYAARLFLALPVDWTRVDRLVTAILVRPLCAYAGKGAVAATAGATWTPVQQISVKQLYIPGLLTEKGEPDIYPKAFANHRIQMIATR